MTSKQGFVLPDMLAESQIFCSSLPLVIYEASAAKIVQQPRKTINNYNQVSAMLEFRIAGKGLKMAGWINEAFSRTSG